MKKNSLYQGCRDLPISNFFGLLESNDLSLLVKEGSITDFEEEQLHEKFLEITKEYHELKQNQALLDELKAKFNISFLEYEYEITKELIRIYNKTEEYGALLVLNEMKWNIKFDKDIEPQLKSITHRLKGIKNQIKIKKSNFVRKYQKKYKATTPNFNLDRQLIELEIGIPLNYKIDPEKDSISKYVHWLNILEEKNKAIRNGKV